MYLTKMFLLLLAGPFCISVFMKRRAETMITPYICAVTLLSFLLGCADRLAYSYPVFCTISILCWAAGIAGMICKKNYADVCKFFLTPGMLFFLLLSTILFYGLNTLDFTYIDEYTYWGTTMKRTFSHDGYIWNWKKSYGTWNHYLQGASTISYLFMKSFGPWRDGIAIWSLSVFLLSALSIFFASFSWKSLPYLPFCFFAVFVLPLIVPRYNYCYASVYVDVPIAVLFGFIFLYYARFFDTKDILSWIVLLVCCPVLAMLKNAALFFAILFFIAYLLNELIKIFCREKTETMPALSWQQKWGHWLCYLLTIFTTIATYNLWIISLNFHNLVYSSHNFDFSLFTKWYYNGFAKLTGDSFLREIFLIQNIRLGTIYFSFFGFTAILLAILFLIAWQTKNKQQKRTFLFVAWGTLAIVIFCLIQLFAGFLFVSMFGKAVAETSRYMFSYFLFAFMVTVGTIFLWAKEFKYLKIAIGIFVAFMFIASPGYYGILKYIFAEGQTANNRVLYGPTLAYQYGREYPDFLNKSSFLYTDKMENLNTYSIRSPVESYCLLFYCRGGITSIVPRTKRCSAVLEKSNNNYLFISNASGQELALLKGGVKPEAYPFALYRKDASGKYDLLLPSSVSFDFERVNLFDMSGKLYRHKRSIAQKHSGAVSEELDLWKKSHAALSFKKLNYSTKPLKEISMYILPKKGKFKLEVSLAGKNIITQEFSGSGGWVEVKKNFNKKTLLKDLVIRISSEDGALLYLDDVRIDFAEQPESETKK